MFYCEALLYDEFRLLEKSLEGEVLKTQDLPSLLITVSKNPKGYKLAWGFLRAHWYKLVSK